LLLIPADEESLVAVHDGVRPFVAAEVIHRCFETAAQQGAVVPVVPVVDTVRELLEAGESRTVSRDRYRLVQTPQTFRTSLLLKAYQQPYQTAFTDDASVVEALGAPVTLVEGNRENIKLTTPFDLLVAESILQARAR
jgi:2-C-methyl-D-erythritol 4-phosphate cytidylyltransferase